jgi:hypothetical protein
VIVPFVLGVTLGEPMIRYFDPRVGSLAALSRTIPFVITRTS